MLDLKQFINQTLSLPLSSHKNMVGGLILGLSVLTASRGERLELSSREQERKSADNILSEALQAVTDYGEDSDSEDMDVMRRDFHTRIDV